MRIGRIVGTFLFVLFAMVNILGCMSNTKGQNILDFLVDNGAIHEDWTYVDNLNGIGRDVGGEGNLPDRSSRYYIYKDSEEKYICVCISETDSCKYEVKIYEDDVIYDLDYQIKGKEPRYYVYYNRDNVTEKYTINEDSKTGKYSLD